MMMMILLFHFLNRIVHAAGIYGGFLLGVRSVSGLAFYDWETSSLVRRIEITPKMVRNYKLYSLLVINTE